MISRVIIKRIFTNSACLTLLNLSGYLLSFVLIPYLISIFTTEIYGEILFYQAICLVLAIFIDFGFQLSGVRLISLSKNNRKFVSTIFYEIYFIRLTIFFLITAALYFLVYGIYIVPDIFPTGMVLFLLGSALSPFWFFLGVQKTVIFTLINFCIKLLYVLTTFFCVKSSDDISLAMSIWGGHFLLISVSTTFFAVINYKLSYFSYSRESILKKITDSLPLFTANITSTAYFHFNTLIVGIILSPTIYVYYSIAEKIINATVSVFQGFNNSLFPAISQWYNKKLKLTELYFGLSLVLFFLLILLF